MPGYLVIWKLLKPVNQNGFIVSYVTQRVSPGIPKNRIQLSNPHQSKQELKLVTRVATSLWTELCNSIL